jgi:uncharacterized membrane protein
MYRSVRKWLSLRSRLGGRDGLHIFATMNKEDQIEKIESELKQLYGQVQQQQQRIIELHNHLMQLSGKQLNYAPKTVAASNWISENFIGLRIIHLIGIVVLVIGLSIGVKYAIDSNLISEELRIMLAYAAGVILFILALRLKKKYIGFSAVLLSGAMASLYFTTYAAFVYYAMMPFAAAFTIMTALTVFTTYQSIFYSRQEIALLGLVGAYGIPFLISQNSERADLFFLYITLINIGVVFLSIKKSWQLVGRVAQAITWTLFIVWAASRYSSAMETTGILYLAVFYLLFALISILKKIIFKEPLTQTDAYGLLANNIAFYVAALLIFRSFLEEKEMPGLTFFVSIFMALQALAFYIYWKEIFVSRLIAWLSLLLFILFIALNWDGLTVTLLWLLTAVVLFIWGVMNRSALVRIASIILMGTTLFKLITIDSITFNTIQKVISYIVLGILLLVVSYFYQRFRKQLFSEDKGPLSPGGGT